VVNDDEVLRAFEAGWPAGQAFHHLDHLRVAWAYLRRDGRPDGGRRVRVALRRLAAARGAADRYHETVTRFWIRLLGHLIETFPDADRFETLLERFPRLADKALPLAHYRPETLHSVGARTGWVAPDRRRLP
jgi:hypothetical protein